MENRIRNKIEQTSGSVNKFAIDNKIRVATVYDFLNKKKDTSISTLKEIMEPLGMAVLEKLPNRMVEVNKVNINCCDYEKGDRFEDKRILFLFVGDGTEHMGMILKAKNNGLELRLI